MLDHVGPGHQAYSKLSRGFPKSTETSQSIDSIDLDCSKVEDNDTRPDGLLVRPVRSRFANVDDFLQVP